MPFQSEKQRRWMHANKPEMAKRWEDEASSKRKKKPSPSVKNSTKSKRK